MNAKELQKKARKLFKTYRRQIAGLFHYVPPGPFIHLAFDVALPLMVKGKNYPKLKNEETDFQFIFNGMPGTRKWFMLIDHGTVCVRRGELDFPRTIVNAEARAFMDTLTGHLAPEQALMSGKLTLNGPAGKMKIIQSLFYRLSEKDFGKAAGSEARTRTPVRRTRPSD